MADLKKVLKGLTICTKPGTKGCYYDIKECPYDGEGGCRIAMMRDALELLKKQEPVKPTWLQGNAYCASCGLRLSKKRDESKRFCPCCGKAVNWDG